MASAPSNQPNGEQTQNTMSHSAYVFCPRSSCCGLRYTVKMQYRIKTRWRIIVSGSLNPREVIWSLKTAQSDMEELQRLRRLQAMPSNSTNSTTDHMQKRGDLRLGRHAGGFRGAHRRLHAGGCLRLRAQAFFIRPSRGGGRPGGPPAGRPLVHGLRGYAHAASRATSA